MMLPDFDVDEDEYADNGGGNKSSEWKGLEQTFTTLWPGFYYFKVTVTHKNNYFQFQKRPENWVEKEGLTVDLVEYKH